MDWESGKQQMKSCILKYRYVILILLAGVMILLLPGQQEELAVIPTEKEEQIELQAELEEILAEISGVGKVQVLLTEAAGVDTIYQLDENRNQTSVDTVTIMNSQREESGLIKQILPPEYRGAVVVCRGGDRPEVRLAVVDAVKSVTGLSSDRITVLKMK